jgi:hypothetical protein
MKAHRAQRDDLQSVPSVGPSIAQDLRDLGVTSVAALARRDPERLYRALNRLTGATQDPCVLYTLPVCGLLCSHCTPETRAAEVVELEGSHPGPFSNPQPSATWRTNALRPPGRTLGACGRRERVPANPRLLLPARS